MNRRIRAVAIVSSLMIAGVAGYALRARAGGIPSTGALSYSGILQSASGPTTGTHTVQVSLYASSSATTALCQSAAASLSIVNGYFTVPLPDTCTTAIGANPAAYVDVQVDGTGIGRTPIGAVPYAVEANHATTADTAAALAPAAVTGTVAASTSVTQTVRLVPNATYLLATTLTGGHQATWQTYVVHSPANGNLDVTFSQLLGSTFNDGNVGLISLTAQDGTTPTTSFNINNSSNQTINIKYTSNSFGGTWGYTLTRIY
jgi:hypothetical protein